MERFKKALPWIVVIAIIAIATTLIVIISQVPKVYVATVQLKSVATETLHPTTEDTETYIGSQFETPVDDTIYENFKLKDNIKFYDPDHLVKGGGKYQIRYIKLLIVGRSQRIIIKATAI